MGRNQEVTGGLPSSPAVKTVLSLQGAWVRSLVRELRSCMLCSAANVVVVVFFFKSLGGIFDCQAEVFRMGTWRGKVTLDTEGESWGHRRLGTAEVL